MFFMKNHSPTEKFATQIPLKRFRFVRNGKAPMLMENAKVIIILDYSLNH